MIDSFNLPMRDHRDPPIARPQFMWEEMVRFLGKPAIVLEIRRRYGPPRWRYRIEQHIRVGAHWRIEKHWVDESMLSKLLEAVS